ncbi:MAG: hypothetical protein CMC86_07285 [Flavobacteriaceae bacterium]|nr:hypothetical protein [Flavobacteriaceae bacterium]
MQNSEIINKSKSILKDNYGKVILPFFIVALAQSFLTSIESIKSIAESLGVPIAILLSIVFLSVSASLTLGLASFSLSIANNDSINSNKISDGFSAMPKAIGLFIIYILIILIGFICFIIPGIIFTLMFAQVFYIAADKPDTPVIDCFQQSASIMKGHKWQYFKLSLRYSLYFILSVFTLFIWALWLLPQMYVSTALFYKKVSEV